MTQKESDGSPNAESHYCVLYEAELVIVYICSLFFSSGSSDFSNRTFWTCDTFFILGEDAGESESSKNERDLRER